MTSIGHGSVRGSSGAIGLACAHAASQRAMPCDRLHRRPPARPRPGRRRRLAHHDPVQGARPARDEQARPDPGHRRRPGRRGGIRRTLSRARSRDAVTRRGAGHAPATASGAGWSTRSTAPRTSSAACPVWATLIALVVDDEVVLSAWSRRRSCSGAGGPPTDSGAWTGRSLLKATRCQVSDVRRLEDASLSYSSLHGWDERGRLDDFLSLIASLLAHPGVRRLLVLHAARRGAVDLAAEPELAALRHGRARRDRPRGRRAVHLPGRHRRARSAATRWPPTATCTTRRCRSSARCPTATTTPTHRRASPARSMSCARDRHPRRQD